MEIRDIIRQLEDPISPGCRFVDCVVKKYINISNKNLNNLRTLDLGCGDGSIAHFISGYVKLMIGLDIDKNIIKSAYNRSRGEAGLFFLVGDGLNLPFPDESFDCIICHHVYEHTQNANRLFEEIYRVLKRDGFCYLSCCNRYAIIEPHYKVPFLGWLPKNLADSYVKLKKIDNGYRINFLSYRKLKRSLGDFNIHDYTLEVFKYALRPFFKSKTIYRFSLKMIPFLLKCFKALFPAYFFILTKKKKP